ncbi:MAG: ATP-binding protein [Gammaproteobacteria bacterium]
MQSLYLHDVINHAVDAVRQSAAAKGVRCSSCSTRASVWYAATRTGLHQVLWNLLTNAVKFTPNGGRVQIILERVNSHVEIVVEDSGVGIRGEFLPYVFDRFRQADASTTRRYGGLGLGAVDRPEPRGAAWRLGSREELWARTGGSTFTVALPISQRSGAGR